MSRVFLGICVGLAYLGVSISANAGLMTTQMAALDSKGNHLADATAVHGRLKGNDTGNGNPLLTLLNSGGTATLLSPDPQPIEISSTGMFSTDSSLGSETVDLIDGSPLSLADGARWTIVGKSDDSSSPFSSVDNSRSGTLELDPAFGPMKGSLVVSLKAGNGYSAFAFANVSGVSSFRFSGLPHDLGHATLFAYPAALADAAPDAPRAASPAPEHLPEPATLAIFAAAGLMVGLSSIRRRQRGANWSSKDRLG